MSVIISYAITFIIGVFFGVFAMVMNCASKADERMREEQKEATERKNNGEH